MQKQAKEWRHATVLPPTQRAIPHDALYLLGNRNLQYGCITYSHRESNSWAEAVVWTVEQKEEPGSLVTVSVFSDRSLVTWSVHLEATYFSDSEIMKATTVPQ